MGCTRKIILIKYACVVNSKNKKKKEKPRLHNKFSMLPFTCCLKIFEVSWFQFSEKLGSIFHFITGIYKTCDSVYFLVENIFIFLKRQTVFGRKSCSFCFVVFFQFLFFIIKSEME